MNSETENPPDAAKPEERSVWRGLCRAAVGGAVVVGGIFLVVWLADRVAEALAPPKPKAWRCPPDARNPAGPGAPDRPYLERAAANAAARMAASAAAAPAGAPAAAETPAAPGGHCQLEAAAAPAAGETPAEPAGTAAAPQPALVAAEAPSAPAAAETTSAPAETRGEP